MLNKITIIGNIGKNPQVRRLENGSVVAKLSVATTDSYKDKSGEWISQTEWHDVVLWRHLAERAEKHFKKGDQIYVEGKMTYRTVELEDGTKRYYSELVAKMCRKLGKKEQGPENNDVPTPQTAPDEPVPQSVLNGNDDDLPF